MIKFILIIFLKGNFVSAQLETAEHNKASLSNMSVEFEHSPRLLPSPSSSLLSYIKNSIQNLNIILKENNKNQKMKPQTTNETEKNLSIELESAFAVTKNNLREKDYNRKYSIPYIDTNINYEFSKNLFFEMSFEFAYTKNTWDYSIEEFFIKYKWLSFQPTDLILGYFEYPVLNFKSSNHNFSKKTLLEKNLFPEKMSDIGAFLKVNFWESFYLKLSSQTFMGERELLLPLNTAKNTWTASVSYEKKNQHITASYLKQNLFSKKQRQAFGLSSDLSYQLNPFLFNFKGEFWKIHYQPQNTLSYYVFPSVKWRRLALSFLVGKAYYQLGRQTSESLEYILKTDFYLTDELFLSLEQIKESDTIVKNSSWIFSIRSHFKF